MISSYINHYHRLQRERDEARTALMLERKYRLQLTREYERRVRSRWCWVLDMFLLARKDSNV